MKKVEYDPDHIFLTSDTHFGHSNIIRYCNRPFKDIEEMNEILIENWNKVVSDDDTVFHLGDFAFGGFPLWERVRSRLKGHITLIRGNHEHKQNLQNDARLANMFDEVTFQKVIKVENNVIYLNHFPFLCYPWKNNVWQAFGHLHTGPNATGNEIPRLKYCYPTQYDVGVDNNNYTPISYLKLKEIINKQIEQWNNIKENQSMMI